MKYQDYCNSTYSINGFVQSGVQIKLYNINLSRNLGNVNIFLVRCTRVYKLYMIIIHQSFVSTGSESSRAVADPEV